MGGEARMPSWQYLFRPWIQDDEITEEFLESLENNSDTPEPAPKQSGNASCNDSSLQSDIKTERGDLSPVSSNYPTSDSQ